MRNTRNSKNNNSSASLEIFTTWSDKIQNRLDPFFYRPYFEELEKKLKSSNYPAKPLKDIADFVAGYAFSSDDYSEDGISLIRIQDITNNGVNFETEKYLPTDYLKKFNRFKIIKGDILISMTGALKGDGRVGKVALNYEDKPALLNQRCGIIRVNSKEILQNYLYAFLNTELFRELLVKHSAISVQVNTSETDINSILIPIPPLSVQNEVIKKIQEAYEQKKKKETEILKILSSIDDFVLGELGIDMPRGGAERAFQIWSNEIEGRIDAFFYMPFFKTLQKAIENKNFAKLGELVEFAKETWDQKSIFDDQFPYIEISNIDTTIGEIAKTDFVPVAEAPSRAKMVVREGDIIVSTTRPNRGAITPISKEQDGFIASTGFAILRDIKNSKVLKDYLFVALRTSLSLRQMEQRTTGGNYPAITTEDLRKIKIVVPELKTQVKIVAGVKTIYEKTKRLRQEAESIVAGAQKEVEQMILA